MLGQSHSLPSRQNHEPRPHRHNSLPRDPALLSPRSFPCHGGTRGEGRPARAAPARARIARGRGRARHRIAYSPDASDADQSCVRRARVRGFTRTTGIRHKSSPFSGMMSMLNGHFTPSCEPSPSPRSWPSANALAVSGSRFTGRT